MSEEHRTAGTPGAHGGRCRWWTAATRACWCSCTPAGDAANTTRHNENY